MNVKKKGVLVRAPNDIQLALADQMFKDALRDSTDKTTAHFVAKNIWLAVLTALCSFSPADGKPIFADLTDFMVKANTRTAWEASWRMLNHVIETGLRPRP